MKKENKAISDIGYQILRPFLRLFVIVTMNPKIINKQNVPKKGGFVFAGTHKSAYDFMLVGSSTLRAVHFLTKKELMDKKGVKWFFKMAGLIRVDRSKKNPEAVDKAIATLNKERVVCVFPEGTINKTQDYIMPFKPGAVAFSFKTRKPIVPFAIIGKPQKFKYRPKIVIGKAYLPKSQDLEKEVKVLENKVIELIKEA